MDISEIHFHDTRILRVIEDPEQDTLTMEVSYPVDWENNEFEPRILVFANAYNYQVHEMPFHGAPTILDVDILGTTDRWTLLRLQTNAGFRDVTCVSVMLTSPEKLQS